MRPYFRTVMSAAAVAVAGIAFVGCTTTMKGDSASGTSARASVDAQVDAALEVLTECAGLARDGCQIQGRAGVPRRGRREPHRRCSIDGRGALRVNGRTEAYYSTTAGSLGFQAGAQSKAVIYVFTTQQALDKFRSSKGWTVGADATVALATIGANGSVDKHHSTAGALAHQRGTGGRGVAARREDRSDPALNWTREIRHASYERRPSAVDRCRRLLTDCGDSREQPARMTTSELAMPDADKTFGEAKRRIVSPSLTFRSSP